MQEKLNNFLNGPYFVPIAIILVAIIAFCLGRVSGLQEKRDPVRITNSPPTSVNNPPSPPYIKGGTENTASVISAGAVVASKNGTKYHYPWCAGAKQISAKNSISFNSIEEAQKAGYTPASNCKGLK